MRTQGTVVLPRRLRVTFSGRRIGSGSTVMALITAGSFASSQLFQEKLLSFFRWTCKKQAQGDLGKSLHQGLHLKGGSGELTARSMVAAAPLNGFLHWWWILWPLKATVDWNRDWDAHVCWEKSYSRKIIIIIIIMHPISTISAHNSVS